MVHMCYSSTQLASGRGLDQHGLRLLRHMLLLCSAVPSGYVCVYVYMTKELQGKAHLYPLNMYYTKETL